MKKILLVDDTKEIYQMVYHSVGELAEVTWAKCLDEASTLLVERKFSLIILDIELPDGNGIDFCAKIMPEHPETPVLLLSSHSSLAERKDAFIGGGNDFVTKPFSPAALRQRIQVFGK